MDAKEALFNQPPRQHPTAKDVGKLARALLNDSANDDDELTVDGAYVAAATLLRTAYDQVHRDKFDEQLAGAATVFTEKLDELIQAIKEGTGNA